MNIEVNTTFAPQLYIPHKVHDIGFYERAFNAVELRRFLNDDGSVHVAEFSIGDQIFHLHEENTATGCYSPLSCNGITAIIGLFVADVDAVMDNAVAAGASTVAAARNFDYGYRQGELRDPFGHHWLIEQRI